MRGLSSFVKIRTQGLLRAKALVNAGQILPQKSAQRN
jgi:hypothetical protein